MYLCLFLFCYFFFFNDTSPTEIYTLSLHDALPISGETSSPPSPAPSAAGGAARSPRAYRWKACIAARDRKSTRLNSSHQIISYAVFCLKKKKNNKNNE